VAGADGECRAALLHLALRQFVAVTRNTSAMSGVGDRALFLVCFCHAMFRTLLCRHSTNVSVK